MDGGTVNVYLGSYAQADTLGRAGSTGHGSGRKSVPLGRDFPHAVHDAALRRPDATLDPYAMQRAFPERWQTYLHENFRDIGHVCRAFNVTDKAARRWWNGEGGANGAYTMIAMALHPVQARRVLCPEALQ